MRYFKRLIKELKSYLDPEKIELISKAFDVAKEAHEGQRRHTGEAYITHPVAVATILAGMQMDVQTIAAAILHDVIEDSGTTKAHIEEVFGKEVAELVDGVSKLTQIQFETRAHAQAENFRKMIMAMAQDIRVIIIKLADRLHNMRTLSGIPPEKAKRVANETLEIYAPIANRLGMHAFRVEYEELGFAAIHPMRYNVLKKAVKGARGNRKGIVNEIEGNLRKRLKASGISPFTLKGREKHVYSIFHKMRGKQLSFSEIMDIYGFRVIVESADQCYRVLGELHSLYKPLPHRFKDYIAIPKANGYQSLHTTLFGPFGVPVEIQIRSMEMDHMAENGIAAHWIYKSEKAISDQAQERANEWIKSVVEIQQSTGSSLEFIENVKIDLFPDEVYVFTPQGNIMELPAKATPVDFAYAIHSDIGNTCAGAKLDRRFVPLSTQLISGQTVEIITSENAHPNPSWLNFVVTGKAKSNIRHSMKTQRRDEAMALGKKLLEQAVKNVSGHPPTQESIEQMVARFQLQSSDELYQEVGLGRRIAVVVAQQMQQMAHEDNDDVQEPENLPLEISGTEGLVIHYATCCRPIPGDPIVGQLDPGNGLYVHDEHCDNMDIFRNQKSSEKLIPLVWEEDMEAEYPVELCVEAENQRGILASVAQAVSDLNVDISNIHAEEDDKFCSIYLTISVQDRQHLASIFRRLRRISGVMKITR